MATKGYGQFLMIGDSHIQRASRLSDGYSFGAELAELVERRLDVVNRGFSGYNTSHALAIFDSLIPDPSFAKVDYLLLLFGSNDSCLPECPTNQHIPLEKYRGNLLNIINHPLVKIHNPTIILVTPPPVNEVHLESEDSKKNQALSRLQVVTAQYADAVRSLAGEHIDQNVVLVDLWNNIMERAILNTDTKTKFPSGETTMAGTKDKGDNEVLRSILEDGLHLTGDGYKMFFSLVRQVLRLRWPTSDAIKEEWVFPRWENAPRID
ncbi:putative GDSL esterase/lipase [Tricladium varicosporioides]|nr:putative GDSL esterase/lipase [Hymenoscyphus varicosporioides]